MSFLMLSSSAFSQNIESVKSNNFNGKVKMLLIYVGVSDKKLENTNILNAIRATLPNKVFPVHTLIKNVAWLESPEKVLEKATKQVINDIDGVLVCNTLEKNANVNSLSIFGTGSQHIYEMKIINPKTGEIIYRCVSEPWDTFVARRFIKKAIKDGVL